MRHGRDHPGAKQLVDRRRPHVRIRRGGNGLADCECPLSSFTGGGEPSAEGAKGG